VNKICANLLSVKGGLYIGALLFTLLMIKLTWFTEMHMYDVQCQASAFDLAHLQEGELLRGDMLLQLIEENGRLSLAYYSAFDEPIRQYAIFEGELVTMHSGSLTYDYNVNMTDYKFAEVSHLNDYLLHELNLDSLKLGQFFPQSIQVIEADLERHFLVIKFSPSNQLWACKILP